MYFFKNLVSPDGKGGFYIPICPETKELIKALEEKGFKEPELREANLDLNEPD